MLLAGFLALHVAMDLRTPYTSEAALQAPVIGVAPNVSGDIVEVGVRDNQRVAAGDVLFRIDPSRYAAALRQAEAELDNILQQLDAQGVGLGAAEAAVVEARARLADVEQRSLRTERLFERGYATQAALDAARSDLAAARADVRSTEAQLAEARGRLGPQGEDNPQVRAALAARERAQIDLRYTTVAAPVDGVATNTVLSVGQNVGAGQHVATVIDTASAWIVAQIPENALGGVAPGDPVDIVLDVAPGRMFRGRLDSVASGVEAVVGAGLQGDLPTVVERRVWLRDVQRIPVRIEFETLGPEIPVRVGARASVVIHTRDAGFMSAIARAWLWTVAYARYAF
jgi:multidrug resistance efflux pump